MMDWQESTLALDLAMGPQEVPGSIKPSSSPGKSEASLVAEGYRLVSGKDTNPELKGHCHSLAFGYNGESPYHERIAPAFRLMVAMPWYRPDLDLMILDPTGQPAAMMGFWYDEINRWAHLEPAGTVPEHRRKGLGRWLIQEGARRLAALLRPWGPARSFVVRTWTSTWPRDFDRWHNARSGNG